MKKLNFLLACVCSLTMALGISAVPAGDLFDVHVSAEEIYDISTEERDASEFTYDWDAETGTLTVGGQIPEPKGSWENITQNIPEIVNNNEDIRKIIIAQGTTAPNDCSYLFSGLINLTDISGMEYLNTKSTKNMSCMFSQCMNIISLNLTALDTHNVDNMSWMFMDCDSINYLDMSNFDTRNVTKMTGMFFSCDNLLSISLNKFNTENVLDMESMFSYCHQLTQLDLSYFNTKNVTNMRGTFFGNSKLEQLNIDNFNTSNVIDMSYMFGECISLKSLELKNFNTIKVEKMKDMFKYCGITTIDTLDLSSFDVSNVSEFDNMLYGLSLKSLILPKEFKIQYGMGLKNQNKSFPDIHYGWAAPGSNEIISGDGEYAEFTAPVTGEYRFINADDAGENPIEIGGDIKTFAEAFKTIDKEDDYTFVITAPIDETKAVKFPDKVDNAIIVIRDGGSLTVRSMTSKNDITVKSGTVNVTKSLTANDLTIEENGVTALADNASVTVKNALKGNGTIKLGARSKPITLKNGAEGMIKLVPADGVTDKTVFLKKQILKAKNTDAVRSFDASALMPADGKLYGLAPKGANVTLQECFFESDGVYYADWSAMISILSKTGDDDDNIIINVLGDTAAKLKFPSKGKYKSITVNGGGKTLTLKGTSVALTGDTTLIDITIAPQQSGKTWKLDKKGFDLKYDEISVSLDGAVIK